MGFARERARELEMLDQRNRRTGIVNLWRRRGLPEVSLIVMVNSKNTRAPSGDWAEINPCKNN